MAKKISSAERKALKRVVAEARQIRKKEGLDKQSSMDEACRRLYPRGWPYR